MASICTEPRHELHKITDRSSILVLAKFLDARDRLATTRGTGVPPPSTLTEF